METYRSGHNGHDSKSWCPLRDEGSNPSVSANETRINPVFMRVFHTHIAKSKHIYVGEQISMWITQFVPQCYICGKSREIGSFLISFLGKSNVMGNELLNPRNQPPLSVGGILKVAYSTNSCIAVNGYVILILKIKFYNRIRKRFLIKNEVNYNAKNRRKD